MTIRAVTQTAMTTNLWVKHQRARALIAPQPMRPAGALWHLQRCARAVGRLEAELVERGLQRLRVARARERRAADGVDVGALRAQRLLLQGRLGGRGDLRRARVVAGEHEALDVRDLAVLDRHADLDGAVLGVDRVAGRGAGDGARRGAGRPGAAAAAAGRGARRALG